MALWGNSTTDESKPKYLDRVNKNGLLEDCFADERGWILRHFKQKGDKAAAVAAKEYWDEVIVAIGGLAGGTSTTAALGGATISAIFFEQESLAQTDTGTVALIYNEKVDVTAGATLVVTGSVTGAVTATYARGTGSNRIEFDFTVPSQAEDLSIGAQTISGTIEDAGTSVASDKVVVAEDVIGAGGEGTDLTITVA